jgi:uncharacterized membrane protein
VVFPDEDKAHEGVRAFEELHQEDTLTVYAGALVVKDAAGNVAVKEKRRKGPFRAAAGALLGGLVGLIGGPPVAALGAAAGGLMGGWRDALDLGGGLDFVEAVSRELTPGKSAILAEVEEDSVMPLDSRMEALGGVVHRASRDDFEDERIRREAEARRANFAQLEAERAQAEQERRRSSRRGSTRREPSARRLPIAPRRGWTDCGRRPRRRSKHCKSRPPKRKPTPR